MITVLAHRKKLMSNAGLFFAHFLKTQPEENSEKLKTQSNFIQNSMQIFEKLRIPATFSKISLNLRQNIQKKPGKVHKLVFLKGSCCTQAKLALGF